MYDLQTQRMCPTCYATALELHGIFENAPVDDNCTCRLLRPPGTDPTAERLYTPTTTRNIKLRHIGRRSTAHWQPLDWHVLTIIPFETSYRSKPLGITLQFVQYLDHTRRTIGLPNSTRRILDELHIGSSDRDLEIFLQIDIPRALKCPNPLTIDRGPAVLRLLQNRERREMEHSCNITIP